MPAPTPYEQARLYTFAHLLMRLYQAYHLLNQGQEGAVHRRLQDGEIDLLFPLTRETIAIWDRMAMHLFADELAPNTATAQAAQSLVWQLQQRFPLPSHRDSE